MTIIHGAVFNWKHLISFEVVNQHLMLYAFVFLARLWASESLSVMPWISILYAIALFSQIGYPMWNQAGWFTGEKPGDFKSCFTLQMSMELFWGLILSELFPEDRKIQDSLRISSCVNSRVDLSFLGISLMCLYSCFYSWWAVGDSSQLALLVLFPLITFASSIQIWSLWGQGLSCNVCITKEERAGDRFCSACQDWGFIPPVPTKILRLSLLSAGKGEGGEKKDKNQA